MRKLRRIMIVCLIPASSTVVSLVRIPMYFGIVLGYAAPYGFSERLDLLKEDEINSLAAAYQKAKEQSFPPCKISFRKDEFIPRRMRDEHKIQMIIKKRIQEYYAKTKHEDLPKEDRTLVEQKIAKEVRVEMSTVINVEGTVTWTISGKKARCEDLTSKMTRITLDPGFTVLLSSVDKERKTTITVYNKKKKLTWYKSKDFAIMEAVSRSDLVYNPRYFGLTVFDFALQDIVRAYKTGKLYVMEIKLPMAPPKEVLRMFEGFTRRGTRLSILSPRAQKSLILRIKIDPHSGYKLVRSQILIDTFDLTFQTYENYGKYGNIWFPGRIRLSSCRYRLDQSRDTIDKEGLGSLRLSLIEFRPIVDIDNSLFELDLPPGVVMEDRTKRKVNDRGFPFLERKHPGFNPRQNQTEGDIK